MKIFVLGGQGFVGSAIVRRAQRRRHTVTVITRHNYASWRGQPCDLLINANGNSKKFLADQDPSGVFEASVTSVLRSLVDFPCKQYVYLSSIDVYPHVDDCRMNRETAQIDFQLLSRYGLHKYLAEQLVRKYARDGSFFDWGEWLVTACGRTPSSTFFKADRSRAPGLGIPVPEHQRRRGNCPHPGRPASNQRSI